MRLLRPALALAAASSLALAGCTDPSPGGSTPTDATSSPTASADGEGTSASATDGATTGEPETTAPVVEEPVFGMSTSQSGGGAGVCLDLAGEDFSVATPLTAVSDITLTGVTLEPASPDVEILEQYVLEDARGGLVVDDSPPNEGEVVPLENGYELAAGETVMVAVGFSVVAIGAAHTMDLGVTYEAGDGASATTTSGYQVTVSEACSSS